MRRTLPVSCACSRNGADASRQALARSNFRRNSSRRIFRAVSSGVHYVAAGSEPEARRATLAASGRAVRIIVIGLTNEGNRRPRTGAKPRIRGVRVDRRVRGHERRTSNFCSNNLVDSRHSWKLHVPGTISHGSLNTNPYAQRAPTWHEYCRSFDKAVLPVMALVMPPAGKTQTARSATSSFAFPPFRLNPTPKFVPRIGEIEVVDSIRCGPLDKLTFPVKLFASSVLLVESTLNTPTQRTSTVSGVGAWHEANKNPKATPAATRRQRCTIDP